ncbi:hypothetical protein BH24CHL5_BH24CHL5_07620 [soil metagenome]
MKALSAFALALAAIEWPAGVPVLSARDAGAPSLSDVVAGLRERANG